MDSSLSLQTLNSTFRGPIVDLALELHNTSHEELKIRLLSRKANEAEKGMGSGDSFMGLKLHLRGPGPNVSE